MVNVQNHGWNYLLIPFNSFKRENTHTQYSIKTKKAEKINTEMRLHSNLVNLAVTLYLHKNWDKNNIKF